jgi:hypothetical protein
MILGEKRLNNFGTIIQALSLLLSKEVNCTGNPIE